MRSTKSQKSNHKQISNHNDQNSKRYDLEDRTLSFAKDVIRFVKGLPRTVANTEIRKQLIRSSSSIGANYIEANEALGKKDFLMHIRICRKESKETVYWLKLLDLNKGDANKCVALINEATQLTKIFSAIAEKSK